MELTFFTALGGVSSFAAILFSIWKYLRSIKIKVSASSFLKITESNDFIAGINVLNKSENPIEIWAIRFVIFSWDQSPKLKAQGILKVQRVMDYLFERDGTWFFPSDIAQAKYSDPIPCYLMQNQSMSIYINLDKMMKEHFNYGEGGHFENWLFFWWLMKFLKIRIETTDGECFEIKAHREIRHYLYAKYKDDPRILAYPKARA